MDELIGQHLRGYEITELLGQGGYGAVYRAFQPAVGRDVAIKVILPVHAENPEFTARFASEAQLVAQLEHPYIVPLYDYWQDENGAFLVMRLVKGGSLRNLMKDATLEPKQILRLYDQVGTALAIAHDAGVVHRDIKPDNILLDQYSNAYLTDFGIAKRLNIDIRATLSDDEIIGTPGYLSPEQIRSEDVSGRTDIYALGIMLYELLTGTLPFDKPGMQLLMQHLQEPVPSVREKRPDLPEELDSIITRATAKETPERFEDVLELVEALRAVFAPVVTTILAPEVQPRVVNPNQHVFISYSRSDNEFVQRLIYDLESEGIPVWVDKKGLKPGTRNWEDALRDAIRQSSAVLLVASPASRRSNYVLDELAIAEMYSCPVYPVWADGEEWIDSIPMGMGKTQYIDARASQYNNALMELVMLLGGVTVVDDDYSDPTRTTTRYANVPENFQPRNPYKGLRAFRGDDQGDFFGRTGLIHDLTQLIEGYAQPGASRLLAVIGPSGSGKSSVVMAGLLPVLQKGALPDSNRWFYVPPVVPGNRPLENLAIALSSLLPLKSQSAIREDLQESSARGLHTLARQIIDRQNARLVLYIDQFEELFTQTDDESERQQFINLLLTAVTEPGGPVTVIITLRADFYDRPMNYPELGRLIESNSKSVLPMSLSDLFDVVQKPAQLPDVMLQFDPGLVAELVFEVRDQAGGLPLLQFTLDQLFQRRNGRRLTNAAYQEIGGVRGALAKHTESTYENLPSDAHRQLARGLFLRLIEPGATEQDTTRRRAPRHELTLADPQQNRMMDEVINAFVNARLLLADQAQGVTTVEVSHEALIREWARLATWLEEARTDITRQQNISTDTQAWVERQRQPDDDGLYRGTLLEDAQLWAKRNLPSQDETAFIEASAEAQRKRQAEDERIARRVENFRRAALLAGVVGVLAIIAFIAAVLQVNSAQSALAEAEVAQAQALEQVDAASTQVAQSGETLTPIPLTLTPVGGTLNAAQDQLNIAQQAATDAGILAINAQAQAQDAETQVAEANQTQTPVALTLVAGNELLVTAQNQVEAANTQAYAAETQVAGSQLTLAPIPLTLTPVALTLASGQEQLAAAEIQVEAANTQAYAAETQVAESRQTLTPIPLTLTPVALTLIAGEEQLITAQYAATDANEQANAAGTLVAVSGATLTPVPQILTQAAVTLAAGAEQLATGDAQLATAQLQVTNANLLANDASTQAMIAGTSAAEAQVLAGNAQTQVADSNLTQTPVALTLSAGGEQLITAQFAATDANNQANNAGTLVAVAGLTLTPVPQTLTPVALTLAAGDAQLATARVEVTSASRAAADAATQVVDAQNLVIEAGLTLTPVPLTLTPVGATLAAAAAQIAGVQPTLDAANTQVAGVQPTVDTANTQVAGAGITLTPLAGTLVAAELRAQENAVRAQSQSLAVFADQAANFGDNDLALSLALESIRLNPELVQPQRLLNQLVFSSARFSFSNAPVAALSPDGRLVAAVNGSLITVWDVATRQELFVLSGHTAQVNALDFNPDGTLLVSASADTTLKLWDMAAGTERFTLTGHTGPVNAVQFNPDGTTLVSGGDDNINILWNPADGTQRSTRSLQNQRIIFKVQWGAGGQRFWSWERPASASSTEVAMIYWEGTRNALVWTSDNPVYDGIETRNLRYAVSEKDNTPVVWDGPGQTIARRLSVPNGDVEMTARGLSTQGSRILVAYAVRNSNELIVQELDYATGELLSSSTLPADQRINAITYSPDGLFAALGYGKAIILWDVINLRQIRTLSAHTDLVQSMRFTRDGRFLLSQSRDGNTRVWDVSGQDPAEVSRLVAQTQNNEITFPGFSSDGSSVYAALRVDLFAWDPFSRQQINRILVGGQIVNAVYSPTEPKVLALYPDGASIWDLSKPPEQAFVRYMGGEDDVFGTLGAFGVNLGNYFTFGAAAYSPDGTLVAMDGSGFSLRDVTTNGRLITFDRSQQADLIPRGSGISGLAITPDNRYVLAIYGDANPENDTTESVLPVIIWDATSGEIVRSFGADQHTRRITDLAISANGLTVLTASKDGTLILWDLATGRLVRRYTGHTAGVNAVSFTPDGQFAISASDDSTLILWDVEAGQLLRRISGHNAPVLYLTMSPNGVNFASSTGDNTIIVWELETIADVIRWTYENRFVETLSCDEAQQYGLNITCNPADSTGAAATATPDAGTTTDTTAVAVEASPTVSLFATSTATPEPCFVRTDRSDVPVRVGPGINRTIRSFLQRNQDIRVTGKEIEVSTGDIWWRLAPPGVTTELDRYWVHTDDVEEVGNCDPDVVPNADESAVTTAVPPGSIIVPTRTPVATTAGGGGSGETQPTAPPAPTQEVCSQPISPNGPGTVSGGQTTFSWTGMASADQYFIIVYDAVGGNLVFNDSTASTAATLDTSGWPASINWTAAPYRAGAQLCISNYVNATK